MSGSSAQATGRRPDRTPARSTAAGPSTRIVPANTGTRIRACCVWAVKRSAAVRRIDCHAISKTLPIDTRQASWAEAVAQDRVDESAPALGTALDEQSRAGSIRPQRARRAYHLSREKRRFEAANRRDGDTYSSPKCFLFPSLTLPALGKGVWGTSAPAGKPVLGAPFENGVRPSRLWGLQSALFDRPMLQAAPRRI